jgi:hypothetical protein
MLRPMGVQLLPNPMKARGALSASLSCRMAWLNLKQTKDKMVLLEVHTVGSKIITYIRARVCNHKKEY